MARITLPRLTKWEPTKITNTNLYIIYTNIGYFVGEKSFVLGMSKKKKASKKYDPFKTKKQALSCISEIAKPLQKEKDFIIREREEFYQPKGKSKTQEMVEDELEKEAEKNILIYVKKAYKKNGHWSTFTEVRKHLNKIGIPIKQGRFKDLVWDMATNEKIIFKSWDQALAYLETPLQDLIMRGSNNFIYLIPYG